MQASSKKRKEYSKGTKREAEVFISKLENKKGRALTQDEKDRMLKQVAAKRIERNIFSGLLISFGIAIGAAGANFINKYKNRGIEQTKNTITIDTGEAKKDIKIENKKDLRQIWVNGKRVDLNSQEKEIQEGTENEISNLETKEEVLNYLKKIYVEEYNKSRENKIGVKDVTLRREKYIAMLDEDKAKNGDEILRVGQGYKIDKKKENVLNGIITVQINNNNRFINENIVEKDGKYYTIYEIKEEVKKYKENTAAKLGSILDYGINLAVLKEGNVNKVTLESYENKLIEEICKWKKKRIEEIKGTSKIKNSIDAEKENER